jgi:CubicO group peptidase (beta-lactamase class C family)
VVEERVLGPAGMATATFDLAAASQAEHAVGHQGTALIEPTTIAGFACGERMASTGLYASAADHGRFLELLLAPGRVLDQASLDQLHGVDHLPGFGAGWSYGYQTYGLRYKGVRVFHHYGSSDGFTGGVSWIPELGFGVVLLTNADEGTGFANVYAVEELRWWIIDRFVGLAGDPPDNSTPSSTWDRYEGTFVSTQDANVGFTFTRDADAHLSVTISPSHPLALTLDQGGIDVPYEGGDVFHFLSGSSYFLVTFFSDDGVTVRYANVYSSVAGHHVAERAP